MLCQRLAGTVVDREGRCCLRYRSAQANVEVWERADRRFVRIEAPVLFKAEDSPELYRHVAVHANDFVFGHLSAVPTPPGVMVVLSHCLLADYLDAEELMIAVGAMLGSADSMGRQLKESFGGCLYHDD